MPLGRHVYDVLDERALEEARAQREKLEKLNSLVHHEGWAVFIEEIEGLHKLALQNMQNNGDASDTANNIWYLPGGNDQLKFVLSYKERISSELDDLNEGESDDDQSLRFPL